MVLGFVGIVWLLRIRNASGPGEGLGLLGWVALGAVMTVGLGAVAWGTQDRDRTSPERDSGFCHGTLNMRK